MPARGYCALLQSFLPTRRRF
jgi:hypothetical protein